MNEVEIEVRVTERDIDAALDAVRRKIAKFDRDLRQTAGRAADAAAERLSSGIDEGLSDGVRRARPHFDGMSIKIGEAGSSGGKRLVDRVFDSVSRAGPRLSETVGSAVGRIPPQAQAAIAAGVVGGVGLAAPAVSSLIAGAVTAGAGATAAGAGVAAAFRVPAVKAAGMELAEDVKGLLDEIGADFASTTTSAIGTLRTELKSLGLREALAPAADMVPILVDGLTGFARGVMPGVRSAIAAAEGPLRAVSDVAEDLGGDVGDLLSTMAEHADEGAAAIDMFGDVLSSNVQVINTFVDSSATLFGLVRDAPGWVNALTGPLGAWAKSSGEAAEATDTTRISVTDLDRSLGHSATAVERMATHTKIMTSDMDGAIDAAGDLATALDVLNGRALDAREAERAFQEAVDDARDALEANGRTLDTNTAKGRANAEQLDRVATSVADHMNAIYEQTVATQGSAAAQAAATQAYEQGRQQLIETARQMGMSKAEARAYADEVLSIPERWTTDVDVNTAGARARVRTLREEINDLPRHYRVNVTVAQNFLTFGKPFTSVTGIGGSTFRGLASGGNVGGSIATAAAGGPRGNTVLVGEQGPELAELPFGTRVIPAGRTSAMLSGGGGTGPVQLQLSWADNARDELTRALARALRVTSRQEGGAQPQVAVTGFGAGGL